MGKLDSRFYSMMKYFLFYKNIEIMISYNSDKIYI